MQQHKLASQQFGNAADNYLTSPVHANGADLQRLADQVRAAAAATALDLGCGAGHASYAMAAAGAAVTACDPAPAMLAVVAREAGQRGLGNIVTRQGRAEALPFAAASFDLIVTRFSAHHWSDLPAALREARRVLKPGGSLVAIDTVSPEHPLCDTILQTLEILADASHVRNYRISEWQAMLRAAGFAVTGCDAWTLPMAFPAWLARKNTPAPRAAAIREVLAGAADEARQYFRIQADGSFNLDVAWLGAEPAGPAA